jgi:hypothetical protein
MKYPLPNDLARVSRASCCSSAFSALLWYGPLTVAEVRWINLETFAPWSVGLLGSLIDCGINLDKRMNAEIRGNIIEDDSVIADRIRVIEDGKLIGELIETDVDGDFRVLKKIKTPDVFD